MCMRVVEMYKNTNIYLSRIVFHLNVVTKLKIKLIKYRIEEY